MRRLEGSGQSRSMKSVVKTAFNRTCQLRPGPPHAGLPPQAVLPGRWVRGGKHSHEADQRSVGSLHSGSAPPFQQAQLQLHRTAPSCSTAPGTGL